jgi:hypothetical protein
MRGSRLSITSSAGGAGLFCGRVLWRTGTGGVTEYETLMGDMQVGRQEGGISGLLRGLGALGAVKTSRRGNTFSLPSSILGSIHCLLTWHVVQQGVDGNRASWAGLFMPRHS